MSDFAASWHLSRQRFTDCLSGLSAEQLNWRIHPGSLTIGEMALHVAGVETWFVSQLQGVNMDEFGAKLASAATDGVVNEKPFPFDASEVMPELVQRALLHAYQIVDPVIADPQPDFLAKEIKSALGPMISGHGALARLAFHSAYHQGQAYLMQTAPGFPK